MSAHPEALCGWFGKLPSLGDFASRRLPTTLVEYWDNWLSDGLSGWQGNNPDGWLQQYLAGPSWRFLLLPGCLPGWVAQAPVAGVLMPSVDRVGRYFPFTMMLPLRQMPGDAPTVESLLGFLVNVEDLAMDAMEQDWPIDRLESELEHLAAHAPAGFNSPVEAVDPPGVGEMHVGHDLSRWLGATAWAMLASQLHGHSMWWCPHAEGHRLRIARGLPEGADFEALFAPATAARVDTFPTS